MAKLGNAFQKPELVVLVAKGKLASGKVGRAVAGILCKLYSAIARGLIRTYIGVQLDAFLCAILNGMPQACVQVQIDVLFRKAWWDR